MRLDWVLHPAMPYAVIAIALVLCLFLFLSLKRDLRACEARWRVSQQLRWEALEDRWKELSHISNLLISPPPLRSGLNLSKRSQALQMHRRGDENSAIAAALSISQNEVELLIKVQRITQSALSA